MLATCVVKRSTQGSTVPDSKHRRALPTGIESPIRANVLERMLLYHPDRGLADFLVNGFRHGFDIMYAGPLIESQTRNLRSAYIHKEKVLDAIDTEVLRGHTAGPFPYPPFPVTHCSPLGAVNKASSEKVRLILDLSQPKGISVNEGIMDEYCHVKYTSFDEAVSLAGLWRGQHDGQDRY